MDSSEPGSVFLRSTSAVSLHERFSQVLVDQLTRSRMVTFDPFQLQQRKACDVRPVLRVKKEPPSSPPSLQLVCEEEGRRRRSVWARLGWQKVTRRHSACRPKGFWSFRNKYRWSARSTCRRRTPLTLHLQGGGASASRWSDRDVPTRKQLDAQLDRYMSTSKRRLDQQLDDYMSMSRSRLDAELDEYMSMAGQTHLDWD
ncbi:hypothetical protein D5F01_LYC13280 [Larimichthys crocea]|uniref:Chromatin target of PRMT1 protein C-terminal domain-containing protein n=1 Tax=Larimichthys crocea TaxID=215358 RepID=A0A6G0IDN2_LARCR|nr:hypothetical protein D5F01_LYC13280 [Larimichthys crocea]